MSYSLICLNEHCLSRQSFANNIVDLIGHFVGKNHMFTCPACASNMYIEKHFNLQEKGETWEPYLKGIVTLGMPGDTYQPFIYLVSDSPKERISSCWFCYYKDTRKQGGNLKLGHGPGGPPVLSIENIKYLVGSLKDLNVY